MKPQISQIAQIILTMKDRKSMKKVFDRINGIYKKLPIA